MDDIEIRYYLKLRRVKVVFIYTGLLGIVH